jgi:hypothetical protein
MVLDLGEVLQAALPGRRAPEHAVADCFPLPGATATLCRKRTTRCANVSLGNFMDFGDRLVRIETVGAWTLHFHEVAAPDGAYLCTYVELQLDNVRKCRLSVVRPEIDIDLVVSALRARAIDWLTAWERRDHSGTTDFADL